MSVAFNSEPLGGILTTAPGSASPGASRADVFVGGTERGLWQDTWNGSVWSPWGFSRRPDHLGSGGSLQRSKPNRRVRARRQAPALPTLVERHRVEQLAALGWNPDHRNCRRPSDRDSGTLDVFARGTDNGALAVVRRWWQNKGPLRAVGWCAHFGPWRNLLGDRPRGRGRAWGRQRGLATATGMPRPAGATGPHWAAFSPQVQPFPPARPATWTYSLSVPTEGSGAWPSTRGRGAHGNRWEVSGRASRRRPIDRDDHHRCLLAQVGQQPLAPGLLGGPSRQHQARDRSASSR